MGWICFVVVGGLVFVLHGERGLGWLPVGGWFGWVFGCHRDRKAASCRY